MSAFLNERCEIDDTAVVKSGELYNEYGKMNDREKRQLIEELISEIQIYPERQPNGQWLKSIKFRLPIIEEDMNISLDNEQQVETVCLLVK